MREDDSRQVLAVAWIGTLLMLTASLQAGSYQVGVAPSTVKVMIQGAAQGWPFEGAITNRYDLSLARGEHEAMQVVIIATDALTNAHVAVSLPQEVHGAGPLNGEAKAWLVGHVDGTDTPMPGQIDSTYLPGYRGWFPDPLLTFTNTCNITNVGDRVAFWIDVATLRETTAGDYAATITVIADNSPTTTLQLNIHVWDFQLPLKASLPTAFSLSKTNTVGGEATYIYGSDYETKGMEQKFWDLLLTRRMGMTHLYTTAAEDFNAITYWAAAGESVLQLKKVNSINHVKDSALATLVSQVSGAGLFGMSYVYGFDEVNSDMFPTVRDVFNEVHTRYPGLRTMTTAHDSSFGMSPATSYLRTNVDIWVPVTSVYNQAAANQLRAEGKDMWWYFAIGPNRSQGYINLMVEHRAIEARLVMGLMAYKYQTGGFLYYQIARWMSAFHQPGGWITSGPYTDWDPRSYVDGTSYADGDGSIFCAGPDGPIPTIRTENIRDGLEDYEYLKLLENLVKAMSAISPLTAEQIAWTNSAQQLLLVPSNLVGSLTSYTEDPAALENYRKQLATTILTGKALTAPPRPQLSTAPAATGNVCLLWATNLAGFNLEASTNLGTTNWSAILPSPVVIGTNNVVTNGMDTPRKFYRLCKP